MKKTLLFVCLFGSASLAFAEDTATKTEVYTQVGRLDERITETRSILDNRITNERKELDDRITGVDVRLNQTDKNLMIVLMKQIKISTTALMTKWDV